MKRRLLDFLCCPDCRGETLAAMTFDGDREAITEGALDCTACGSRFPVIAGVPRLLPRALRPHLARFHADFFARHPEVAPPAPAGAADARIVETLAGFSFQHVRLADRHRELERWRRTFFSALAVAPEYFAGKVGADIGCGPGRHLYWAAASGAEVIGVDLSEGVEVAARDTKDCHGAHVVQADIYHLPLRASVLDFAYSIGVLHHLPEPREGFRRVLPALKPGGRIFVWVYGLDGMRPWYRLSHLTWLRPITPKLPRWAQCALSALIAAGLDAVIWLPARLIARVPGGHRLADRIPLGDARHRSFRAKVRSVLDRLQPAVTHYHGAEELSGWLREARLTEVVVRNRDGRGWSAAGAKPRVSVPAA